MQQSAPWNQLPLTHVVSAVKSRIRQTAWRQLAPYGLSPQQFQMLMAVAEEEGACPGDLARRTWMDKPTASRVLRALETRRLLRIEPDPLHGRKLKVFLDPGAHSLVQELLRLRADFRENLELGLSVSERAEVRRILAKVMDNLDRMEGAPLPVGVGR